MPWSMPCTNNQNAHELRHHRPETLELLQRAARRRHELRRLRGAAHLPAVPQDGRRAQPAALEPAQPHCQGLRLAVTAGERRRRAVRSLPPPARRTGQGEGHHRPDLCQGAEQVSRPGQTAPPGGGPDRLRKLVGNGGRCEGRRLRGPAGKERAGHQERRRPILHAAPADPGHGGLHRPQTRRDRL